MLNILITSDYLNLMKLAKHIINTGLKVDGSVASSNIKDNGISEYHVKFKCDSVDMLQLFHSCGKAGIDLNVKALYNDNDTTEAICWKI